MKIYIIFLCALFYFFEFVMSNNPEVSSSVVESPEVQQLFEYSKAGEEALKEQVMEVSKTKEELSWFSKFFVRLWDAWNALIKEWNISKAISILFWNDQQKSPQDGSSSSIESADNTTTTTWVENTTTTNTPIESKEKDPKDDDKVFIKEYIPDIKYDLVYATKNNSFWTEIYSDGESNLKLEYDAVKKLAKAQEILKKDGLELKIWDAYRPDDAQFKLWDNYKWPQWIKKSNVAEPKRVNGKRVGSSHHWTWKAVDLTLVDSSTWKELEMPTCFDDFSWKARWESFIKNKDKKTENAFKLRYAMEQAWFYTIPSEWWHYQTDEPKNKAPR